MSSSVLWFLCHFIIIELILQTFTLYLIWVILQLFTVLFTIRLLRLFNPNILPCLMILSLFFWSNSRGPGGLTESREKGLFFPNRYQYVPPAHKTNHTKKIKNHIVEKSSFQCLLTTAVTLLSSLGYLYDAGCQRSAEKGAGVRYGTFPYYDQQ